MDTNTFDQLKIELSVKAKNGVDFILAACVIWSLIAVVWTLPFGAYNLSILTFMVGGLMLPLALLLGKLLKTTWKVKDNPLQPLGLWLNFAQLFYFPFLVFLLLRQPDRFVMGYVIITGAHFFPYAWYYKDKAFAIMAGIIAVGGLVLGLTLSVEQMFVLPLCMAGALVVLAVWIHAGYRKRLEEVAGSAATSTGRS